MLAAMSDEILEEAKAVLQRAEGAARDSAAAASELTKESMDAAYAYLVRQARERPLATIGVAAGVGLLLGMLLTRRD